MMKLKLLRPLMKKMWKKKKVEKTGGVKGGGSYKRSVWVTKKGGKRRERPGKGKSKLNFPKALI